MQTKKNKNQYITALYCRLSNDDGFDGESNSIVNQKRMLMQYAEDHGFENMKYYVDDGYTGTNFKRPGFRSMIDDCDDGFVKTVIVKDMSRFGREYIQVGYYTENYFPEMDIRFIAVADGIDSEKGEDEFAALRNVVNEQYARDGSKKQKMSNRTRGNHGEPLSPPPYGYLKDPENKKRWIVDPESADVVRRIFSMNLEGKGVEQIAKALQQDEILTPTAYWREKGIGRGGKKTQPNPYKWQNTTVLKILARQEYCGDIINFKTYSKSFKNKKRYPNAEENIKVFKDVHEPIIDRETFERVQELRKNTKSRPPKKENGEKSKFCDLVYCADCGHKMHQHTNIRNKDIHYFSCSNYVKDTRGDCQSRHYVREDSLEEIIKLELKQLCKVFKKDEAEFVKLLADKANADMLAHKKQTEAELRKATLRREDVTRLYMKLYEDNATGKISDEWFMEMSGKYEAEKIALKEKTARLQDELTESDKFFNNTERFVRMLRRFMDMKTLTAPVLKELIDRIEVYETEGVGKNRTQRIKIYFRFVGQISLPKENKKNYTAETRQGVAIEYITAESA